MKYFGRTILVLTIVLGVILLAGCGGKPEPQNAKGTGETKEAAQTKQGVTTLRFPGSPSGGSTYTYAAGIGSIINKYSNNVRLDVFPTAGVIENERLLREGQGQLTGMTSDIIINAVSGKGAYEGKPNNKIRILWRGQDILMHSIVKDGSPIKSYQDYRGKKVGTGAPGAMTIPMLEQALKAYDMSLNDVKGQPITANEQVEALKDGTIDAFNFALGIPTPAIVDLTSSIPTRFIELSDDAWVRLSSNIPEGYYVRMEIPANSYTGQERPVKTFGVPLWWVASADVSDEVIYEVVKTFFDHKTEADQIHPLIKQTTSETAIAALPGGVDLHPGAARYFKEIGWLK